MSVEDEVNVEARNNENNQNQQNGGNHEIYQLNKVLHILST